MKIFPEDILKPDMLVAFDLDRTITRHATFTLFLFFVAFHVPWRFLGFFRVVPHILLYALGYITRDAIKERLTTSILKGLSRQTIEDLSKKFVERQMKSNIRPGAKASIQAHKEAKDKLVLITAAYGFYAKYFAAYFGFDYLIATKAEWNDENRLTGRLKGRNCYGQEKIERFGALVTELERKSIKAAYSDHHTDIPLLELARNPVAVNPSPNLRIAAIEKGYEIVDWDKTGVKREIK